MCGLTGFFLSNGTMDRNKLIKNLNEMTSALIHRGPDAQNIWINNQNTLGLGHTRLSIRDLSSLGNQPMLSSCGRYVIIYNGEIYSHSELKEELIKEGVKFKSTTDTEIILESISKFGFKETLLKLNGMFAIAVYDKKEDKLFLTRDKIGIKPLYWGKIENNFFFGSELKSIKKFFGFKNILNKIAINYFIKWGFITAPLSIYENVYKVMPGEVIEVDKNINIKKTIYWKLSDKIKNQDLSEDNLNYQYSLLSLENLINDSVKKSLVSDVPIGSFLSGGIDSTIVSYFMQKNSKQKIKTFSLGFEEIEFDESQDAKKIAQFIGSDHNELYFSDKDIINHFDKIPEIYDEPFADSSQMPTSLISEYAKKSVSAILSGDGGDELFGGYNRYVEAIKRSSTQSDLKNKIKNQVIHFMGKFPGSIQKKIGNLFSISNIENRINNYHKNYAKKKPEEIYVRLLTQFTELRNLINDEQLKDISDYENFNNSIKIFQEKFMYFDTMNYLPEDILTKVDRASMHYSLEVRVPLLDYRIVEFAWSLPIKYKIKGNSQKIILKDILKKKIPTNLIKKDKMGFGIPVDKWLRTILLEKANYHLSSQQLRKYKIFNSDSVIKIWDNHKNNIENNGYKLWNIIILQQWFEYNEII
jgi:asparagine synthase (glutamine-hydrolysing)